jgi:hypothetical protein
MTTKYIQCEDASEVDDELQRLLEAEAEYVRELYAAWNSDPGSAPDWWQVANSPTPPTAQQGTDWDSVSGWHTPPARPPKRAIVLPITTGGHTGAVFLVPPERDATNMVDKRVGSPRVSRGRPDLTGLFLARVVQHEQSME